MTFRPTALACALVVLVAWAFVLAIALGRVELFLVAVPLLVPLLCSPAPVWTAIDEFHLAADPGPFIEGERFSVTIGARMHAPVGPVEVLPVLPALLELAAGSSAVLAPAADGRIRWDSQARCTASGIAHLAEVFFRTWDQAGLWVAEYRAVQRTSVAVYPEPSLVRSLPKPRRTSAPYGGHLSRTMGDGTDFADIRPFAAGDRVRRINWRVSLRLGSLHSNRFHADRSGDVILLLDAFTNIGRRPHASLDHCLRAAASLAMAYLGQRDRVGLLLYGGWMQLTRPAAGRAQYTRLLESLARATVSPTEFARDLAALPEATLPRHALIVALTPLADERFTHMIERLADQGRDVVLLALRTDEVSAAAFPALAAQALLRRLWLLEREERLRELRGHRVRAVNWSPLLPLEAALVASRLPIATSRVSW